MIFRAYCRFERGRMSNKVEQNFWDIFRSKGVNDLIQRGLKKYVRAKRRRVRLNMFMDCQGFVIDRGDIKREYQYNEVYNGYFEIYSGIFVAEQFAPMAVMTINIERNKVEI